MNGVIYVTSTEERALTGLFVSGDFKDNFFTPDGKVEKKVTIGTGLVKEHYKEGDIIHCSYSMRGKRFYGKKEIEYELKKGEITLTVEVEKFLPTEETLQDHFDGKKMAYINQYATQD